MDKGIFNEREKAMEANYFRQEDAKLLERLRKRAPLDEIAGALREKLQVDNPDLLQRVRDLGVTQETAAAFFVAPLVQVAWADGAAGKAEHDGARGRRAKDRCAESGQARQRVAETRLDVAVELGAVED